MSWQGQQFGPRRVTLTWRRSDTGAEKVQTGGARSVERGLMDAPAAWKRLFEAPRRLWRRSVIFLPRLQRAILHVDTAVGTCDINENVVTAYSDTTRCMQACSEPNARQHVRKSGCYLDLDPSTKRNEFIADERLQVL